MKIAVIGGGSTYTPELVSGLSRERDRIDVRELVLHDIDEQRREIVGGLAKRMLDRQGYDGVLSVTDDLDRALDGADFVLIQIRVGGQEARLSDETVPLACGCIGQETTGAGGLGKALRTVPVVLGIADRMRELAADGAWIVDFTNPVGIVTRSLLDAGHRAVGLCNVAITTQRKLARLLDVEPERVLIDQVGLNHLSWVRFVRVEGEDVLPDLLATHGDELAQGVGLRRGLLEELGVLPSYYLHYFYTHDAVLAEQLDGVPRAATVAEIERGLLELYRDPNLVEKPALLEQRGGAFYSEAAIGLVGSLATGDGAVHVVDVRNNRTIEGMAAAASGRTGVARPHAAHHRVRTARSARGGDRRPRACAQGAADASARRSRHRVRRAGRPPARGGGTASAAIPGRKPRMTRAAVLAVDGGNSKTDLALVGADGSLLALVRGPLSSPQHLGVEGCIGVLEKLLADAVHEARLDNPGGKIADAASLLLAGVDFPQEEEAVRQAVEQRGWARRVQVDNDTFAVLRAGTERGWGVAVTCGAGINCVGVAPDGRHARFPALGEITGDWGGGYDLGKAAVFAAARSEDGRGPRTSLEHAVPAHFGLEAPSQLAEAIHFGQIAERRVIELAPIVFAEAADDAVAAEIVQRLASEVVALARVALKRLGLTDEPAEVLLGGGVLQEADGSLLAAIDSGLREYAPDVTVRPTASAAIVGAALLGLDELDAGPQAQQRLRTDFEAVRVG
jgi:6-phospho-beta-glucosidase